MEFWIFVSVFAIVVALVALWSVSRTISGEKVRTPVDSVSSDIEIYKNQLGEIDADLKRGLIDEESAQEARLELSRNILAAEKEVSKSTFVGNRSFAMRVIISLGILFVPIVTIGVYALTGNPGVESHPFSELMDANPATLSPSETLVRTEALFARNPENGKLADELSSAYLVAGRFQDAVNTYVEALRLNGDSAPRLVGYGMALAGYNGGTINDDALKSFEKAAKLSPDDFYPRLFIAEASRQAGKPKEAADGLQAFLDRSPKNSPWRPRVEELIEQLREQAATPQPLPSSDAKDGNVAKGANVAKDASAAKDANAGKDGNAAIEGVSPEMIGQMVNGLAERLQKQPDDLDGWKMLVHSWLVLKDKEKARAALIDGSKKLPRDKAVELLAYGKSEGLVLDDKSGENRQ